MECLGEGDGLGTDEQGCAAEADPPQNPKHTTTRAEEDKAETYPERNGDRDSERHRVADKPESSDRSAERNLESDLWSLLKEREEEQQTHGDEEQPEVHREPVVVPTTTVWPCGGLLQTFYGTFSPPANRDSALFCVWTLDPQDSRPLRLDLQQLVLGSGDTLTVRNREQGKGDVIKIVSVFNRKMYPNFTNSLKKLQSRIIC